MSSVCDGPGEYEWLTTCISGYYKKVLQFNI